MDNCHNDNLYGKASYYIQGSGNVYLHNQVNAYINDNIHAIAYGGSTVVAFGNTTLECYDFTSAEIFNKCTCKTYHNSTVVANGQCIVTAYDRSLVDCTEETIVTAYDCAIVDFNYMDADSIIIGKDKSILRHQGGTVYPFIIAEDNCRIEPAINNEFEQGKIPPYIRLYHNASIVKLQDNNQKISLIKNE